MKNIQEVNPNEFFASMPFSKQITFFSNLIMGGKLNSQTSFLVIQNCSTFSYLVSKLPKHWRNIFTTKPIARSSWYEHWRKIFYTTTSLNHDPSILTKNLRMTKLFWMNVLLPYIDAQRVIRYPNSEHFTFSAELFKSFSLALMIHCTRMLHNFPFQHCLAFEKRIHIACTVFRGRQTVNLIKRVLKLMLTPCK